MMEVPKPEDKEDKVDEIREVPKKVKDVEPKKEKLIDRIIKLLFGDRSTDPDIENMLKGLTRRFFLL